TGTNGVKSLTGVNVKRLFRYIDGLGRPLQDISVAQSPNSKDIIDFFEFDVQGREIKRYLPYAHASQSNGNFIGSPSTEQATFHNSFLPGDGTYAYSEYEFDNSPLNRVLKERPPGSSFRNHPKEIIYGTNTNPAEVRNFITGGYYAINSLYKTTHKDENSNSVITYVDKIGRKIMVNNAGARTYYIYNDFGNIIAVITPEGSKLGHSNSTLLFTHSSIIPKRFSYGYDSKQRMTTKTIPGANAYTYVYDRIDRLVLTIDANGFKEYTKYDILNRPILTGRYTGSSNTPGSSTPLYENKTATGHFYTTNLTFPTSNTQIYTVTYYDDYYFNSNYTDNVSYTVPPPVASSHYDASAYNFVRSKITGTKVGVLKQDGTAPTQFLSTYIFYDKWGREIQTKADNHLGGQDLTWSQYNFQNWLLRTRRQHAATVQGSPKSYTINQTFLYDHAGRSTFVYHQVGDATWAEKLIALQAYNEKNELRQKYIGGLGLTFLQTVDYKYNIRGWLTDINDFNSPADLFALKLSYGTGDTALDAGFTGG
ncbi:MAG TPA: DUF6443 domain-containing protein, partial [Saprospiraceae bacterium]|nr:DUF6443 domain-containing protein [Saprospiraceae bacterium]